MYIKEMVFANKHYQIQKECKAVLEAVKAISVQSLHMHYNGPENKPSAWWSYSKIAISFKVEFEDISDMFAVCQELRPDDPVKKDKFGRVIRQDQAETVHKIYGEIIRILEKKA